MVSTENKAYVYLHDKPLISGCKVRVANNNLYFENGTPSNSIFTRELSYTDNNIPAFEFERISELKSGETDDKKKQVTGKLLNRNDNKNSLEFKIVFEDEIPKELSEKIN